MRGMLSSTVRICEVMGRSKGCPFFMRSPGNEIDSPLISSQRMAAIISVRAAVSTSK